VWSSVPVTPPGPRLVKLGCCVCFCLCACSLHLSDPRAKHIADLRRFVPSAVQRGTQPFEYWDVGIRDRSGRIFTMRMYVVRCTRLTLGACASWLTHPWWLYRNLPPMFPAQGPVLQILQRVRHMALDHNCVIVGLVSLQRWNGARSSLGACGALIDASLVPFRLTHL